ncbi:MAG TPA: hypothetical protein VJ911_02285, partial [Cryomorphaceae bacterium]|nr:hypothetical protein [Cryomorphaceae bacterium]
MNFLKIILPCLLLSFTTFSKAQNTTTFDGVIQMGGKKYQARYDYFIENGDTIFHGPFTLSLEIEKSDDEAGRAHFSAISGNFKENIPHGEWELRQGSFRPSGKAAFRDYRYSFKINGTEFLAKGSFQDGKKNSDWQIYEWKIVNSAVQDTIFSASFPFKNDRIQGKFKVYDKGNYLQGSIDEGQLASGSWQFFSTDNLGNKKIAKEWRFEENQFAEKTAFVNGNKITLELNPGTGVDSLLEKVELNPEILKIIDLKAKLKNPDFAAEYHSILSARDLLFSTLDKYHTIDSTFSPVLRSEISPKIYVKIERHPYTARENELLKNIQANTKKAVVALREIHRDPQINLARISTQKVAFYMSVLNSIEENILEPNKAIVGHLTSGNLEYIDREEFFKTHFDESLVELDAVTVFNNDTTLEVYRLQKININNGSDQMENIASLSGDILSEIRVLSDSIDLYIEEIKREENLSELEGILIDKYEGVRQLSDSLIGSEQNAVAGFDIGHSIIAFADE